MALLIAALFAEVGLVLVVMPWSPLWDRNYFLEAIPQLRALVTSNYFRGAMSGLGLINIAASVGELDRALRQPPARESAQRLPIGTRTGRTLTRVGPVLCMISRGDAHRPEFGRDLVTPRRPPPPGRGVHLIQIREPHLEAGSLASLVRLCLRAVAGTQAG